MITVGEIRKLYEIKLSKQLGIKATREEIIAARKRAGSLTKENIWKTN